MTYIRCPFNLPEQFKGMHPHLGWVSIPHAYSLTMLWDNILIIFKFSDTFCQHSIVTVFPACCNIVLLLYFNKTRSSIHTIPNNWEKKNPIKNERSISKQLLPFATTALYYQKKIIHHYRVVLLYLTFKSICKNRM